MVPAHTAPMKLDLPRLNDLAPALRWLQHGPAATRDAVIGLQLRLMLRQLPLAFGLLLGLGAARWLGLVEPHGHVRVAVHYLAALAFLWPPGYARVGRVAWRDAQAPEAAAVKRRLQTLSVGAHLLAVYMGLVMLGLLAYYLWVVVRLPA